MKSFLSITVLLATSRLVSAEPFYPQDVLEKVSGLHEIPDSPGRARTEAAHAIAEGWTGQTLAVDPETGFAGVVLTTRTGDYGAAKESRRRMLAAKAAEIPKRK